MNFRNSLLSSLLVFICIQVLAQGNLFDASKIWQHEQEIPLNLEIQNLIGNLNSPPSFEQDLLIAETRTSTFLAISSRIDSIEYQYNEIGKEELKLTRDWDTLSQSWINSSKINSEYNNEDLLSNAVMQVWDGNQWVDQIFWTYEYNEDNTISILSREQWFSSSLIEDQTVFFYNEQGEKTQAIAQIKENGEWVNVLTSIYNYNNGGLLKNRAILLWENSMWSNENFREYSYNQNQQLTKEHYYYGSNGNEWSLGGFIDYELDNQGNVLVLQSTHVDANGNTFNGTRYEYEYNAENQVINFLGQWWLWDENEYINRSKGVYFYDNRNNLSTFTSHIWSPDTDEWLVDFVEKYYYEILSSKEDILFTQELDVFPNPSTGVFDIAIGDSNIRDAKVEIYGLDGRRLEAKKIELINGKTRINLNYLSEGLYVLTLKSKQGSKSQLVNIYK